MAGMAARCIADGAGPVSGAKAITTSGCVATEKDETSQPQLSDAPGQDKDSRQSQGTDEQQDGRSGNRSDFAGVLACRKIRNSARQRAEPTRQNLLYRAEALVRCLPHNSFTISDRLTADGQTTDHQCGKSNPYRHPLTVLSAIADSRIQLQIIADASNIFQRRGSVTD